MAGAVEDLDEVFRPVAGPVVGDDPVDVGDAVRGEERPGAVHERDCGGGLLVSQGFCVRTPGVSVYRRVQVDITGASASGLGSVDRFGLDGASAVGAPTAAVGYAADLLDVDVDHVAGPARDDPAWLTVAVSGRVEESAAVQAEAGLVPADGAHRDRDAVGG